MTTARQAAWSTHLLPLLRQSLRRLETMGVEDEVSPTAALQTADALAAHGALLATLARELQMGAYHDLGRYAAATVEEARHAPNPEAAATVVADAFLQLYHRSGGG